MAVTTLTMRHRHGRQLYVLINTALLAQRAQEPRSQTFSRYVDLLTTP